MSLKLINLDRLNRFWTDLKTWLSANYATKEQGDKSDSAIQNVKLNGDTLTKDANNNVDVSLEHIVASLYSSSSTYDVGNYVLHGTTLYRCTTAISTAEDWNANHWTATTIANDYVSIIDLGNIIVALYDSTASYNQGDFCIHDKKLYQCNTAIVSGESWNASHWTEVTLADMIRESNKLGNSITASITVGGIEAGDTLAAGTSYDDVFNALLNPALYPTLTDPSASLSYGATTYYEVGSTISAMTATVTFNRGSISPAYGTSGYRSGAATNYALSTSGADNEYSSSSESSGSFNVSALTRATKGNIVMTATVSYAAGEQPKDSKGNNYSSPLSAGSKTATKTMQFIQAYYYGKSANASISDFTGLNKSVTTKGQKQFSFTTNNEHMVIAYDSSYGDLTSILDQNGFETISGWTKSSLTVDGFSYYVYVANSATTDTNAQFTFKY